MKKQTFLKEVSVGEQVEDIFGVRKLKDVSAGISCELYDSTGTLEALLPAGRDVLLRERIYVLSFRVVYKDGTPKAIIGAAEEAESYNPLDIQEGISEEKALQLKEEFEKAIAAVELLEKKARQQDGSEGYFGPLLRAYFTQEEYQILRSYPASAGLFGKYAGAALVLPVRLAITVKDTGWRHMQYGNGIYNVPISYQLLITSALLVSAGIAEYVTPVGAKTKTGFNLGYPYLCQTRISELAKEAVPDMPKEVLDLLLNSIHCAVSGSTTLKATTIEGSMLRHAYSLYVEMDRLEVAYTEEEDADDEERGYRYSPSMKRYLQTGRFCRQKGELNYDANES